MSSANGSRFRTDIPRVLDRFRIRERLETGTPFDLLSIHETVERLDTKTVRRCLRARIHKTEFRRAGLERPDHRIQRCVNVVRCRHKFRAFVQEKDDRNSLLLVLRRRGLYSRENSGDLFSGFRRLPEGRNARLRLLLHRVPRFLRYSKRLCSVRVLYNC